MSEPIISVSGLRGVVGRSLTPEVAMRYAAAFSAIAPAGVIVVARDSRPSGIMLAEAVHAALHALGRDSLDAGVAPTPTVGVLVRRLGAAGGIQISASHNPPEYNGLKLFGPDGRLLAAADGQRVLAEYRQSLPAWVSHDCLGQRRVIEDPLAPHLEAVLSAIDPLPVQARRYHVVLDANHGAGGALGRRLLEALGCRATVLGEAADGQFEHPPEPLAENLRSVCAAVPAAGAEVGFCLDPDADRLAVIDEAGRYLGEEYTLALCVAHVLADRRGPVVTNCSSSRMTEDLARQFGVPLVRSAVGEANVVSAMLACGAVFGGEGNGGPIDPRVGLVRDSFVGMAHILSAMARRGLPVSRLADELPRYAIVKTKLALPSERVPAAVEALATHFGGAQADRQDGLRLDWPDRWLLVRPSNTEPIVRAVAEAQTLAQAQQLCDEAARVIAALG